VAEYKYRIRAVDETKTATQSAQKGMKGLSDGIGKVALGMAAGAAAVFGMIKVIEGLTSAYRKQIEAESKLTAILKSTGNQVNKTTDEIKEMAAQFQRMTGISDTAILNAQSILLTFTKIGEDVFPKATETILNMSKAFGTDLNAAAIQLGKALQDPIMGVSALRRVGVQLSDQQTAMIKQFVTMGDTVSAQNIILGELDTQIGGVAKAMGDTAAGSVDKLGAAFGDLLKNIGGFILNAINPLVKGLTNIINFINGVRRSIREMSKPELEKEKLLVYEQWQDALKQIGGLTKIAAHGNEIAAEELAKAKKAATDLETKYNDIVTQLKNMETPLNNIEPAIVSFSGALADAADSTAKIALGFEKIAKLGPKLAVPQGPAPARPGGRLEMGVTPAGNGALGAPGLPNVGKFFDDIKEGFSGILNTFIGKLIKAALSLESVTKIMDWMGTIITNIFEKAGPAIDRALTPIVGLLAKLGNTLGSVLIPIINILAPIIEAIANAFIFLHDDVIRHFANFIIDIINLIINIVNLIPFINIPLAERVGKIETIAEATQTGAEFLGTTDTTGGIGAQYTAGRELNVTINVYTDVITGEGGIRELAILLRNEIEAAEALGL
jgi:Skp family chaperone for outer membrane proteins